jgi:GPI-GlcNAc transferase complex PIG-U subunit
LLIRLAAMPLDGTEDVMVWKTWSYGALHQGVTSLYGVGGNPPIRGLVHWGKRSTTVDYPPMALYELDAVGRAYQLFSPQFDNTRWLNVAVKMPVLLAEVALTWLLYALAMRRYGRRASCWIATAYWANPATILNGAVLGYLDPLMALPAVASVAAAVTGAPIVAGALMAIACLTKAQAIFLLPVVILGAWNSSPVKPGWSSAGRTVGAMAIVSLVIVLPYLAIGAGRNVAQGVSSLLRHDMLSAYAANLWWVVTYFMRASYAVADMGAWAAWTMPMRILGISTIVRLGYPDPRPFATAAFALVALWTLWEGRRARDLSLLCALGGLIVHAYFVLAVAVHENHLYLAAPLLALAAGARPRLRRIHIAVSIVIALNLFLFYGLGRGMPLPPRRFTIIDATVVLAAANCVLLIWHAWAFRNECHEERPGIMVDRESLVVNR